ncbi:aspartate aminotransferase family protein [Roseobacter sp. HKCCD9010]|uniref:aspartate aminotransferase family protein n=1 Tax=unclassified Roseobacter TaxID=196798 RepID=UPI001490CD29|nr:aspartate aminotransferase family protein [Rhodobacterales bacterium HKCCD4356]NNV13151.1 aspartate aminotransferase family protein [Roseobacter sp. HKCCD7357]NNV17402.1 aspartate aminotransferase family protein [Roseobacter sp. HKCCD8768]NNV27008.1 aspartate aminotransferase family protein [Roseobacter sp. HKCCD8192]NNV31128.1 aspartate aminotransferase family protein [Roseobacter sp. HKCCD9061]NNV35390.1 aspartate aminotransferase family protein [Roseobacter sp. HKCCD9073]NNV39788.1 aspa
MSHIFGRGSAPLPKAVRGDGCYLYDSTGKAYLDGSGGAAVSCLGHSDADVRAAVHAQLDQVAFAHTGFFTSDPAEKLADLLIAQAPDGIEKVYLLSGGSEAVEAAIKLARQYFLEIGEPERHRVIARRQSYHGNTLGALAAGGNAWRREKYAPLLVETSHIAPCFEYRHRAEGESLHDYGQRAANELETEIERLGPETVMAFIAEPVVGATAGAVPAVDGYFSRIREICDRYGILLILDEVMCGMGRTGSLFASEQEGISPDIVTIAKGLGAGYAPIGAMLCSGAIYKAIADGSGSFQHGHTYHGHPLAAAAGHAVVNAMIERDLMPRVKAQGDTLAAALHDAFAQHAHVGDIRGRGLFRGIELVEDRATKTPFDPARKLHARVKSAAMAEGLICYPAGGTVDGRSGDHILLAPPFIIEDAQIDELVGKLSRALDTALTT